MTSEEQDRLIDELLKRMNARLMERALAGDPTEHLGYEPHEPREAPRENKRNGSTAKTVHTESGEVQINVPHDRNGSFEPLPVPKGRRRLEGFDEKVIALRARGLTPRNRDAPSSMFLTT
jgi:transposase-like protein